MYYVIDRSVSNVDSSIELHFMGYAIMISIIYLNKRNLIVNVDVHLTLSNYLFNIKSNVKNKRY